jgi:hypothetical protein
MAKFSITIRDFKPIHRNTLVGFAIICIPELHLTIKDVAIHQKGSSRWAALPAKPMIDRDGVAIRDSTTGKITYSNILEFTDRATRDAFSHVVIAALLDIFPNALLDEDVVS